VSPPPPNIDMSSSWESARPADALRDLLEGLSRGTIPSRCLVTTLAKGVLPEVTQMRQLLEAFIDVQALDSDRFLLVLAAHELLTNAVLHGEQPVALLVADDKPGTLVAVLDHGAPRDLVTGPYHGLAILDTASDGKIDVLPVTDGKWVAVHLPTAH
jgi:hypothetical protein